MVQTRNGLEIQILEVKANSLMQKSSSRVPGGGYPSCLNSFPWPSYLAVHPFVEQLQPWHILSSNIELKAASL